MPKFDDLELEQDTLPPGYKEIYQACKHVDEKTAVAILKAVADTLGGNIIYFQKSNSLFKDAIAENILSEYPGLSMPKLAKKYGVCQGTVFNILHGKSKK